jgi:hypothetical protein
LLELVPFVPDTVKINGVATEAVEPPELVGLELGVSLTLQSGPTT